MKIYNVRFRKGRDLEVRALSYTEDTASGRFVFHTREDRSDTDQFFLISEVTGISEAKQQPQHLSLDEFRKRMKGARAGHADNIE